MTAREQIIVAGPLDRMVADLVDVIAGAHPRTLEIAYDRVGVPLGVDEEPGPLDTVRWTATATWANRPDVVVGEHIVKPGGNVAAGPVYALSNLIEQLGGNVVLVDMTDGSDPR